MWLTDWHEHDEQLRTARANAYKKFVAYRLAGHTKSANSMLDLINDIDSELIRRGQKPDPHVQPASETSTVAR